MVKLPDSLRDQLKVPLGILLPGTPTREDILEHLDSNSCLISVGDRTTTNLLSMDIVPSLCIVDGVEKRQKRTFDNILNMHIIQVDNPPGHITKASVDAILHALGMTEPVQLYVNGEEDLLVIPVCIHAPNDATVAYGQPDKGLVLVRITPDIKHKTKAFFDMME